MSCQGITKKGKPCINKTSSPELHFCRLHNPAGREPPKPKENKIKCPGFSKKGQPCRFFTQTGLPYCAYHNPDRPKKQPANPCQGKTQKGKPCQKNARPGKQHCGLHDVPPKPQSNYDWRNFFNTYNFFGGYSYNSYTPPPPPKPPVKPDKIREALQYFGLPENTNYTDIKKKFRDFALKHHPDKGGDTALFQKIQEYYSVLGNRYKQI